jgi:DNA polymerase-4
LTDTFHEQITTYLDKSKTLHFLITVEEPITDAKEIYRLACFLLARERLVSRPLRLLGLGVSNLDLPAERQLALL